MRVYDLLPITTRHRTITAALNGVPYSVSIVSKRTGHLITTCRQIKSELSDHRKIYPSTPETLMVVADWRAVRGAILRIILGCAASRDTCENPENLDPILAPLHIPGRPIRSIPILRRDFSSHEQLHKILRHSAPARSSVSVEIAIECDPDLPRTLKYEVSLLYDFVWNANNIVREGEQPIRIVLRCRLKDEAIMKEEKVTKSFVSTKYPPASWDGMKWRCEVGKTLGDDEWREYWAPGEN
jgi:hypothetical protein